MKKLLFVIVAMVCITQMSMAQQDTFRLNGRLRDSSWFRYSKGNVAVSAMPLFYSLTASFSDDRVFNYGLRADAGYFVVDKLYMGISLYGLYLDYSFQDDGNIQMAEWHVKYFLNDQKRITPYVAGSVGVMRYEYTSTPTEFFLKDEPDKRITHFLPVAYLQAGASIKVRRRFSIQGGLYGCFRLYDKSVKTGSLGSPGYSPLGVWGGYFYHF